MKITVYKSKNVNVEGDSGTQNENLVTDLEIIIPEEYKTWNKKIVFVFEDGEKVEWDFIENERYLIPRAVSKYEKVLFYIWLTNGEEDFRTIEEPLKFNKNHDASNQITDEEIGAVNKIVEKLDLEIVKVSELEKRLLETITEIENRLESGEFNGFSPIATVEQLENGTKIIITDINGKTEAYIYNGEDYVLTENDKKNIVSQVTSRVEEEIGETLNANLEEAKRYADSVKPTKTSELTNDSNFAKTNENNNFSTPQTVNGTLTVNGNIVQNGEAYETHAEKVFTKQNEINLRDGAVGGMTQEEFAGLVALLYNGIVSGRLGFKADGTAYVGDVGDEQPLLTRDDVVNLVDGQVLIWSGDKLKAIGSSDFIKNNDYATSEKAGIMRPANGLFVSGNTGAVLIAKASTAQIDSRTDNYYPIVPSNLVYAVESVVGGHVTLTQAEYDKLVEEGTVDENTYYYIKEE